MTLEELSRYNGKDGKPAYVAYKNSVYDVSDSDMWKNGEHQGEHVAGKDLTEALSYAPHGDDVFDGFKEVAKLSTNNRESTLTKEETAHKQIDPKEVSLKEKLRKWYQVYHPHPATTHFPIALHFFAAGMNMAFLFEPIEKFEQGTYYSFLFATIFGLLSIATGVLSWWINYSFSMIKPLVIKLYTAIFTTFIGIIALLLHLEDPLIAYNTNALAVFYHFSIFITVPAVVVLGYYGGKLTWGQKKDSKDSTKELDKDKAKQNLLSQNDFTVMIGGSAGSGIKTIESLLVDSLVSMGYSIFSTKEYMSRVRGGSNTVQIRISDRAVKAAKWEPDMFLALDELSASHVKDRIGSNTFVVGGKNEKFSKQLQVSLQEEARKHVKKQFVNTFAAGVLFSFLQLPLNNLENALKKRFKEKDHDSNLEAVRKGYSFAESQNIEFDKLSLVPKNNDASSRYIDGTTASGFGFLAGGCNSVTSYPMSPSTGVLAFLANISKDFDIAVEQAEDEIAAFNMVQGVWYAGGMGLTTTSGGGFALMSESMSLSGMTETPAVVYLAQRPGPATGLPTRTEQGDLNLALYSGHGEFPRLILAPGDAMEAVELGHLAFEIADKYQVPAIYLSDQYLADSLQSVPEIDFEHFSQNRHIVKSKENYLRYELTDNGISERSVPGYGEGLVCCDSDEHDERGQITESYKVREAMVAKRKRKTEQLIEAALEPKIIGEGDIAIVGWGSTKGAISESLFMLDDSNLTQVHFSWVYPLNKKHLSKLSEMDTIIVVENNSNAQFADLLKLNDIKVDATILKSNGFAFFSDLLVKEIAQKVKELS